MLILTKGFDVCLAGYDHQDWQRRTQELMSVSLLDKEHIDKRRVLFSGAHEIEFDEQGRCVVPKALYEFMGSGSKKLRLLVLVTILKSGMRTNGTATSIMLTCNYAHTCFA